jgi:hypothetical protein
MLVAISLGVVLTFVALYTVAYVKSRGTGPNSRQRVSETVVAVVKKG